jgi:hypothetical protein
MERVAAGFCRPSLPRFTFAEGGAVAVAFEERRAEVTQH